MAGIDQKERYRQRAALCYDIAATISGDSATAMRRLADTYAKLAEDRIDPQIGTFVTTERNDHPQCRKCGKEMRFTYSLRRTDTLRAMQAFRCEGCGRTMIWKGK